MRNTDVGFENKVLAKIFEPKRDELVMGKMTSVRNFIICSYHMIFLG
jgi:hypothetical protein